MVPVVKYETSLVIASVCKGVVDPSVVFWDAGVLIYRLLIAKIPLSPLLPHKLHVFVLRIHKLSKLTLPRLLAQLTVLAALKLILLP